MEKVYLCHKCGGTLYKYSDQRLYNCHCMSSYVRDWQSPIEDPVASQIAQLQQDIEFFRSRNASSDSDRIAHAMQLLARLTG